MGSETALTTTTIDPNPIQGGIHCPHCYCRHHEVTKTIQSESRFNGIRREYIRRTRRCVHCGLTFATREVIEPDLPRRIKSPEDKQRVEKIIHDTLSNIVPLKPGESLPNPFLPEK